MKTSKFNSFIARLVVLTMLVTQTTQVVALTLAAKPLAATTTSAVRPNLMYVLDDSGSMAWDYTPDYVNDVTDSTGPSNGVADTLTAVRTGGAITGITFTANNAYTLGTPTIVIEGGGGTGASATVTLNAATKKIQSITMGSGGSGYTSLPYVALIGGLPNVTWGMCWGTTGASNLGGNPKDTNVSPQCTGNTQPPYATAAINYQYYDPDIRYELPIKADGTRYLAPAATNASSDGYLAGASKNLTNAWTHEVWCNVSTAVPTAADPTAAGKCREVSDTSADNLFPNISFNFRKTYNGPATYFTMSPVEYCTDSNYTNCVRATTPQVVSGVTFNVPSYYRWCAYYNPLTHAFGACQGRRDSNHAIPNYLGGWVSTGAAGVQATANLVINAGPTAGQKLSNVTIGGVDVVNGTIFEVGQNFAYTAGTRSIGSATDVAQAVCETVRSNTASTGYSCAQSGAMVTLQASVVGTAPNGAAVLATGPATVGDNSIGEIRILTATANLRVNTIKIVRADASTVSLIGSPITATGSEANFAQAVCQAINSGPSQGTYIARSGDPADPGLAYGTCLSTLDAFVGIKRIPADTVDNGATISIVGPAAGSESVGTISINATSGETRLSDITLAGVSVLTSKPLDYADGTLTATIANDVASKISIAGCTATAAGNTISIAGTCTGALAVVATGTAATATFRVSTIGTGNPADLGGVQVNGTQIIGHITNATLTNGTAVSTNATSLRTQINNSTASQNTVGGVVVGNGSGSGHGFSAAAPVLNGSSYDITVTAPVGNAYNNKSFTFQAGTAAAAGAGSSPIWTFPITGATADSKNITSITCGGTTAVPSRSTGVTNQNVNWVANLAAGFNTKVVAGPSGNYTYACSNASMASPQYRCTVTGPANAAACTPFTITPTAGISVTNGGLITAGSTSPQWTFNMSGASAEPKLINSLTCGGTAIFTGSASTLAGSNTTRVDNLATGLTTLGTAGYSYAKIAGAGAGQQRIEVTGPTGSNGAQPFCTTGLSITKQDATITLDSATPAKSTAGTAYSAGSPATYSITLTGATSDNRTIHSFYCGTTCLWSDDGAISPCNSVVNSGLTPDTGNTTAPTDLAANLAASINTQSLNQNGWNGNTNCTSGTGTVSCAFERNSGDANRCTSVTVTTPGGQTMVVGSAVESSTGSTPNKAYKYTIPITSVTAANETITNVTCNRTPSTDESLNAAVAYSSSAASNSRTDTFADDVNNASRSINNWNGTSGCARTTTTSISCTFERNNGAANRCNSVTATGSGITQGAVTESGSAASGYDYAFSITGLSANDTLTSVVCNKTAAAVTENSFTSSATTGALGVTDTQVVQRLNNLKTGLNAATGGGYSFSCGTATNASPSSACTVTGPTPSGAVPVCKFDTSGTISPTDPTLTNTGGSSGAGTAPKWRFDIQNSTADSRTIGPITCTGSGANTLSGTASSGVASLTVPTRLNNLGNFMVSNPAAGWTIAKTSGAGASPVTMNLTGPLAKSGCAWAYTKDAEITASTPVQTAGTGPSTPQWQFDITNATADNLNFGTLTCGGTSLVPAPTPNTGTTPASFAYTRINNLTGAVAGPPVVPGTVGPTNGYTMVCDAATATSPAPVCTLTGPQPTAMVPTACNAGTLVINKDATISVGTVGFTAGNAAASATDDYSPALTTVTAFGVARAGQGTSTSGISSITTGPVLTSTVAMTNGAPSITGIPTNATGTPPDVLTMSGGLAADTSTNNWNGVGILKRVDIVPANNSYSRKSGRTDCLGATCTYAEEIQNFANWYSFYRTRMQMMKSATTLAFNQLDGNYRVGFDNICQATGTTVKKPLAQFLDVGEVAGQRTAWWSQLTSANPSCATPLRAETAKIGRYYAGQLTTQTDPIQYSCQQNFTLLVTDGYWNESEPSATGIPAATDVGNVDNVLALAPRPYYDGAQAVATAPTVDLSNKRTQNSSFRTLADIAQYYYATDIRSSVKSVLVTTAAAHGITPGQSVTISGVVSTPSVPDPTATYNGDYVAHVISANQFRFAPYSGTTGLLLNPGTYVSGGQVTANGVSTNVSAMTYTSGLFGNGTNSASFDVSQDNVITSSDDPNQHQHVNFYAMGLGIDGTLEYRSDYQTATIGDFSEIRAGTRNWPAVANLDPTAVDDMWHATVNGRGKYFSARNLPNVVAGLREALTKIGARVGSAAAAATSNLQPVEGDNFAYVASYATLDWTGDLQSRSIDTLTGNVSSSTACTTPGSGCQWSAQAKLDGLTWSARRIYIRPISNVTGDPLRTFSFATLTGAEQAWFSPSGLSQYATLILSNPGEMTAQNLVDFLRGNRSLEQDGSTNPQIWRFRAHVLGDIVNTQPEFLKAPNKSYTDAGYSSFKTAKAARKPVVFVSAQDGMLHAFNSDTGNVTVAAATVAPGQEMWAYIPSQVMTGMKVLADTTYTNNHRYFVDGPIVVGDVNFGGGDSDWHTILVGGQGAGGTSYFALDVTDPTNPIFLWEIDNNTAGFSNLGYTFSNPVLAKNPVNGAWQVYFTSGYNNADGQGYLFTVNPKTGALVGTPLKTDELLSSAVWVAGVVTFTLPGHNFSIGSNITITGVSPGGYNGSYTVTAITADTFSALKVVNPGAYVSGGAAYDGRPRNLGKLAAWVEAAKTDNTAQYLYAGDLLGDMWRFDLYPAGTGHTGRSVFKLAHLETTGGIEQPITTKPQLTTAPNTAASHLVFIGTGKYLEASDLTNTDVQAVYAIKDELSSTQRTWNPATDTVTVAGSPVPAFLFKKLISTKTDGSPIQWVDEFGGTTPGRNICSGTSSTVSATGTCNDTDATVMDWDVYGGWGVSLPDAGERVNVDLKLTQGTLVFASNIPGASTCTTGGSAFVNFVDYSTGKSIESDGKASRKVPGALVVGITVIKLASGETKVIVTKSDYKQETFKVNVNPTSTFLGKRSLWREFEAY